jgi:hypothetical protein
MTSRWMRYSIIFLFLFLGSCPRHQGEARDARAEAIASAAERLQGRWILLSFVPEVPLDLAMQLLLNVQLGRFLVTVQGMRVAGEGPGVTVERTFRVEEAYGDHFKATIYDAYGVGVDTVNDFAGDTLVVNGVSSPWHGRAMFRRVP